MSDETKNTEDADRRKEAIDRRNLIREMSKGPAKRVAKRMNKQIATIDRLIDEHGSK